MRAGATITMVMLMVLASKHLRPTIPTPHESSSKTESHASLISIVWVLDNSHMCGFALIEITTSGEVFTRQVWA